VESVAAEPGGAPARGRQRESPSPEPPWAAVKRLLRGCQSAMLWPEDRPEFGAALRRAFDGCCELLAEFRACTLEVEPRQLSVMGYPCPPDAPLDRFVVRLRERRIPAITFLEGTTKEEMLELLRLLKADPELILDQGGGDAWLTASKVQHIVLQAPREAAADDPPEWESFLITQDPVDGVAFQRLLALCPGSCRGAIQNARPEALVWLAEALSATAAALPPDSPDRECWLEQATAAVRQLKPRARSRLFRVGTSPESDALEAIGLLLAPEEAAEILVSYPKAVVGEPSEQLEAVLRRLMPHAERARQVEPVAKAMLLSRSMTEESYQNVVSVVLKKGPPAATPADEERRGGGVRRLSLLTDLLASASAWEMQENRVDMLLELIATPGDWNGKQQLVHNFAEMLPASLAERDDDRAVALLRRIEETIALDVLSPEQKRLLRARLAEACSAELSRRLARAVVRQQAPENAVVFWLIGQEESGLDTLLWIAQETPHPWLQQAAGAAIVQMGERSRQISVQKLRRGTPEEAIALCRALVLSGTRDGLERALWAQEHRDSRVVAALMEALAHSRDATAARVLLEALHDRNLEVQRAAARSLGRHPSDETAAALGAFLGRTARRRPEAAEDAIQALRQIGRAECVPPLRALLTDKRLRGQPLQEQAAQALAAMPHPAAEEALREEAGGKSPETSALCAQALARRRSAEVSRAAAG
jgi:hypothetical protein